MRLVKYPSTPHYKQVVTTIKKTSAYIGQNEDDEPIYDYFKPAPTIKFIGTTKLHGSHADLTFNNKDGLYVQTRNGALSLEHDMDKHFGFVQHVGANKESYMNLIRDLETKHNLDFDIDTITLCGEWAGGNIQKNVAIQELPKSFYLFSAKISREDDDFVSKWVSIKDYRFTSNIIFNIYEFPTFEIEIDFNNPKMYINQLEDLTKQVGDICPVAKQLGVIGIGEGIVWKGSHNEQNYMFKTKDDRHAGKSKVKTLKKVDNVLLQKINDVAEEVTPTWRLNQFFNEVTNQGKNIDRSLIGSFIKQVVADVMKEEMETINEHNLEFKKVAGKISHIAKAYFFQMETDSL